MHLLINGSDLGRQRGGNESYLKGLLAGLSTVAADADTQVTLVVASEGARLVKSEPQFCEFDIVDVGPYRRLPFLLWQQTAILRRLQPDWFVSTFFLPPLTPCRAAVLVHDLSFRAHPEYYPSSIAFYMRLLTGLAVRRADVVVALSEFTRKEALRFYPEARNKMEVVYPGIGAEFLPGDDQSSDDPVLDTLGVQRPYFLAVGNIHPRKNLARLLTAWERLRASGRAVPAMVWVGLGRWDSGGLIERARAAGVLLPGFVAPAHLPALVRQAEALVYPSLYEGFGLPPLEAMACGTPALASNTSSLPEAVGDAAVMVDPTSVDALAEGLSQVLFDEDLRRGLRTRGLARAAQFRWEKTARRLLRLLEEAG
jgi:glycosyltransferase involved in cell wall biosynthesis